MVSVLPVSVPENVPWKATPPDANVKVPFDPPLAVTCPVRLTVWPSASCAVPLKFAPL